MTHIVASNRFGFGAAATDVVTGDWRDRLRLELANYVPRPRALVQRPNVTNYTGFLAELRNPFTPDQVSAAMPPYLLYDGSWKPVGALVPRDMNLRMRVAIEARGSFPERLVHFWQNHFAVSSGGGEVLGLAPSFEFDAIRPNIKGNFRDLLLAALRHPAMQMYLGNISSFGPNSVAGNNGSVMSALNENLGRELLELHTLGVGNGYTQADVREVALALTGWSASHIVGPESPYGVTLKTTPGSFIFQPDRHEPGPRTVMGKVYPAGGEEQLVAIVTDLCLKPACAEFLARKISRHFLREDGQDAGLVEALKTAYLTSGGNLTAVYEALISAFDPAQMQPKIKSPNDWVISMGRAMGRVPPVLDILSNATTSAGQQTWNPGSPAGWSDRSDFWLSSGAMVARANACHDYMFGWHYHGKLPPLADSIAASKVSFSPATLAAARAPADLWVQYTILFCSPEFMRR